MCSDESFLYCVQTGFQCCVQMGFLCCVQTGFLCCVQTDCVLFSDEFERLTVCEGEQMEVSCRRSMRIAIYSAMFGRAPNGSAPCPPNRPGYIGEFVTLYLVVSVCQVCQFVPTL